MNTALAVSSLNYSVPGLDILKDLSLEVEEHQYYAIAGVNGAGKSTLIKLILDLIRPAPGGSIRVFGADNRARECRDQLAYLPEKFDVKKGVSGRQYLEFIAAIYARKADRAALDALAERLDFPPARLDSRVATYSKGMVQKLGLLSCFMLERRLLILDEPLSGLDPRARYHFKQLLQDERAAGRTVLYSTHMLADAEELCDRFSILHDGVLKYEGTPAACLREFGAATLEEAYMKCISA